MATDENRKHDARDEIHTFKINVDCEPECDTAATQPADYRDEAYSQRLNRLLSESRRALEDLEVARRRTVHERDAARAEVVTLRADLKTALGIARRLVG